MYGEDVHAEGGYGRLGLGLGLGVHAEGRHGRFEYTRQVHSIRPTMCLHQYAGSITTLVSWHYSPYPPIKDTDYGTDSIFCRDLLRR